MISVTDCFTLTQQILVVFVRVDRHRGWKTAMNQMPPLLEPVRGSNKYPSLRTETGRAMKMLIRGRKIA